VAAALHDRQWIKDISDQLTVEAIHQYVHLWRAIQGVVLSPEAKDAITWRWSSSAAYSARCVSYVLQGINSFRGRQTNLEGLGAAQSQLLRMA
jgi:hypothetical protein